MNTNEFSGKKVLIMGLGLLGGGVAAANWFLKQGAKVTITDLKTKKELSPSIRKIRGKAKLKLGGHIKKDFRDNEIVVVNPDVPVHNQFVQYAHKLGKQVENEATIFYKLCKKPIVAITGTRGKTTTANWTSHFLNSRYKTVVTGNSYVEPLLKSLDKIRAKNSQIERIVNEIPSFHLEFFDKTIRPPKVAVITNIFQDHLNRHGTLKNYALTKSAIFQNQTIQDKLVLNSDSLWTKFFMKQKPKSQVWFFSLKPLTRNLNGVFWKRNGIWLQKNGQMEKAVSAKNFSENWGQHNISNLLAASLAAYLAGADWKSIQKQIKTLPAIPFRQQVVFQSKRLTVINDTAATSPDGAMAAVKRFAGPATILIAGGTDRNLDFKEWGKVIPKFIKLANMIFLDGSATKKMLKALGEKSKQVMICESLAECVRAALQLVKSHSHRHGNIILFSPGAKSFEKFKNEFDRGRKFNNIVKEEVRR